MTFGSLFTGIGGFDLGFERAGMSCAWQCEIEPNARRVLQRHWPNITQYEDVRGIGRDVGRVDVLCGGFPCQDVSVAGKRAGLDGARSGLWFEFKRIIHELGPRTVVIENVPGLLFSNRGRDFAVVLQGLEECGFQWAYRVLDAQYDGLAQRRKRVFIVGDTRIGRAAEILFESESLSWNSAPSRETRESVAASLTRGSSTKSNAPGRRREDDVNIVLSVTSKWAKGSGGPSGDECQNLVAVALRAQAHSSHRADSETFVAIPIQEIGKRQSGTPMNGVGYGEDGDPMYTLQAGAEHGVAFGWQASSSQSMNPCDKTPSLDKSKTIAAPTAAHVRRLTPTECAVLQGFPRDHCGMLSDSAQYRCYGNAVAVPVAAWIGQRIMEMER